MSGFEVGSICYDTAAHAVDAYYSAIPPHIVPVTSGVEITQYLPVSSGSWRIARSLISDTGQVSDIYSSVVSVPDNVYGLCETASFDPYSTSLALSGAILALWAVGWGFGQITSLFKDHGAQS
jgi:hypothetical protein